MVRLVRALTRGVDDVTTPAGARLLVAVVALVTLGQLLVNTVLDGLVVSAFGLSATVTYAATLPVGPTAAAWLLVGAWVVGSYLLVVCCRAFAGPAESLRVEEFTRDALPATLRTAIATALGGTLVLVGLAFGVVPGILVATHLLFVPVFVAVDGAGLDDAVVRSWRVAAAGRVRMLVLTTLALALTAVVLLAVGVVGSPALELLVGSLVVSLLVTALVGVVVDVRRQHDDARPGRRRGRRYGTGA